MATLQQALDRIIKDRSEWLIDAVACATQNRMFLRGEPEADDIAIDAIIMNGEKALRDAIDSSLLAFHLATTEGNPK